MKKRILVILLVCAVSISVYGINFHQVQIQGNSYLEYASDRVTDNDYFEDWTEVYLSYKNWRVGLRYEAHLPPQPFSQDTSGHGLSQRFLEYRRGNLTVTLGNFYSLLGRGLVLRAFENRTIRWDTNLDGAKLAYYHRYADVKLLAGKPRDRSGKRHAFLEGGELNLKPFDVFRIGGSFVTTKPENKGDVYWGSGFLGVNLSWGSFYFERAFKNYPDQFPTGKAYYLSGNLFLGPVTALIEYRNYDQFDLTEGVTYNNPPTVYREHLYTLMNRHQHVQFANDEKGYMVELTYSPGELGVLILNNSRIRNHRGILIYREYYGQVDVDPTYQLNLVGGAGEQRDPQARYLNLVGSVKWAFVDYHAFKLIYEHQHAKILLNDRQYYNQALTASYEHSPHYSVSVLAERSTDQLAERDIWLGGQLDVHFLRNFDLTIFGGRRRKGKLCVGGVCIYRPAFQGIEFRLTHRF